MFVDSSCYSTQVTHSVFPQITFLLEKYTKYYFCFTLDGKPTGNRLL